MVDESIKPKPDPMLAAWDAYKSLPQFYNTLRWVRHSEYIADALWAAFTAGYEAAQQSQPREWKAGPSEVKV